MGRLVSDSIGTEQPWAFVMSPLMNPVTRGWPESKAIGNAMNKDIEVKRLLAALCVDFGFCLPATDRERLQSCLPATAQEFTRAVYEAEGLNPDACDSSLYRQVLKVVAAAYRAGE